MDRLKTEKPINCYSLISQIHPFNPSISSFTHKTYPFGIYPLSFIIYPLTAPAIAPEINWRWKARKIIMIGRVVSAVPIISWP